MAAPANVEAKSATMLSEFFSELWTNNHEMLFRYSKLFLMALIIALASWITSRIICRLVTKTADKLPNADISIAKVFCSVIRFLIWAVAGLIILDLFGFNTASVITLLGAVGLAVALAMKDSMSNVAAGIMLLVLRPYKTGDFVECGTVCGTIKQMGLFCSEVETIDGIFMAVPNNVIFGAPVKNYSRNALRRADITVGIAYDDNLSLGLEVLKELMLKNELICKDPAPEVLVAELADSSVNLTLRFWVVNAQYWDVFWQVKAAVKPALENAGLNIPFPQRVVTFVNAPAEKTE